MRALRLEQEQQTSSKFDATYAYSDYKLGIKGPQSFFFSFATSECGRIRRARFTVTTCYDACMHVFLSFHFFYCPTFIFCQIIFVQGIFGHVMFMLLSAVGIVCNLVLPAQARICKELTMENTPVAIVRSSKEILMFLEVNVAVQRKGMPN